VATQVQIKTKQITTNKKKIETKKKNFFVCFLQKGGHKEVMEYLIGKGCEIDAENEVGETALFAAIDNKNLDAVKLLLAKKANPNFVGEARTPLIAAVEEDPDPEIVKTLLAHGANPKLSAKMRKETPLDLAKPEIKALLAK
jgi:ankyrin repeat protein